MWRICSRKSDEVRSGKWRVKYFQKWRMHLVFLPNKDIMPRDKSFQINTELVRQVRCDRCTKKGWAVCHEGRGSSCGECYRDGGKCHTTEVVSPMLVRLSSIDCCSSPIVGPKGIASFWLNGRSLERRRFSSEGTSIEATVWRRQNLYSKVSLWSDDRPMADSLHRARSSDCLL